MAKHLKLLKIQYGATIISLPQNVREDQKSEECCISRFSNLIIKHKVRNWLLSKRLEKIGKTLKDQQKQYKNVCGMVGLLGFFWRGSTEKLLQ